MDFLIMNRDTVVAEWIDNKLNLIKPSLAPMYLELTSNVRSGLKQELSTHTEQIQDFLKRLCVLPNVTI